MGISYAAELFLIKIKEFCVSYADFIDLQLRWVTGTWIVLFVQSIEVSM